jgi:hypothetical protein
MPKAEDGSPEKTGRRRSDAAKGKSSPKLAGIFQPPLAFPIPCNFIQSIFIPLFYSSFGTQWEGMNPSLDQRQKNNFSR